MAVLGAIENRPLSPSHGVLTLSGHGIRVGVDRGHLLVEDGIGADRHRARFSRVGHGLKRLVVIGSDGMVSLAAIRWLADQKACFVMLERDGSVLITTGPVAPSDSRLRRAQALAGRSGVALEITRELISQKLAGQESVARHKLLVDETADSIARFRAEVAVAESTESIRLIECQAALAYWSAWRTLPINFPRKDAPRVPDHWNRFGARVSPLTGSPRLATNPPNAILNYLYALLESESRLAAAALGLDPGLGVLHVDVPNRDSLACDLMEPVRPQVDAFLVDWITHEPFNRRWFFEQSNGNCRLMASFAVSLSQTAPTWGRAVAPWAEYVAHALWASTTRSKSVRSLTPATRLTQQHRRAAKGRPPLPSVEVPKLDVICRCCGKEIHHGTRFCSKCVITATRENFNAGRKSAQSPEHLARRASTMRRHKQAIQHWNASDLPAWLTQSIYLRQIQPALVTVAKSRIRLMLGVSEPYSSDIKSGKCIPHPRHWLALAKLVGLAAAS
jgi:CRISPR-associated endonuclease Cas1